LYLPVALTCSWRFFLEPVVLTINFALDVLGYDNVVMTGLSGGGWTTTMRKRDGLADLHCLILALLQWQLSILASN
jgi:hypothetical protein